MGGSLDPVIEAERLATIYLNAILCEPLAGSVEKQVISEQCVMLGRTIKLTQPSLQIKLQRSRSTRAHYMEMEEVSNSDKLHLFAIGTSSKPKPLTCEVIAEGSPLVMEIRRY